MHKLRSLTRVGSIVAVGLLTAGLALGPSITDAGNGNGNGGGNGGNGNGGNGNGGNGNGGNGGNGNGHGNGNQDPGGGATASADGSRGGGAPQVVICHVPPGNPANRHTIEVGAPAEPAHLGHGDTAGECAAATTTTPATTTTTTEPATTTTEVTTTTSTTTTSTTTTVVPAAAIAVSYLPSTDPSFCQVVITITGFAPNETYDVTLLHTSSFGTNPASPWLFADVATDAAGNAELMPFTYFQGFPENASLSAEANGLSSGFVNVDC